MNPRLTSQSFLGETSDRILARLRVAVVGLGGGGSHVAQQLAHLGVGHFVLFDPDYVEASNLNRLVGATASDGDAKTKKTTVAERLIHGINPDADVMLVTHPWQEAGVHLRDCDVVFGCVDSYSAREELERVCRRFLIPYIDHGMDVTKVIDRFVVSGQVILSSPGELCMRCLGFLTEDLLAQEAAEYGAAGPRPQVVWPNGLLASAAVGMFVQLLTPCHRDHRMVEYLEYDGNAQTLNTSNRLAAVRGKECPHFPTPLDLGDPFWPKPEPPQRCTK